MFQKDEFGKLVEWLIEDINENLNWTDVYLTDVQIQEIAIYKAKNMINYVNKGDAYEPFK